MKTPIKLALAATLTLGISYTTVLADDSTTQKTPSGLILEIDTTTLNTESKDTPVVHTYRKITQKKSTDVVSKSILSAKKVLKRFTSLRYKKNQKLRALIGKSSYTVQYTHKL